MKKSFLLLAFAAVLGIVAAETDLFPILKTTVLLGKQRDNLYLLPTSQLLHPWGDATPLRGRPIDLAFDSRRNLFAVLSANNVSVWQESTGVQVSQVLTRAASYAGIAFRPGDREIWASEATRNGPDSIVIVPVDDAGKTSAPVRISLTGHPVPTGIAFSADGAIAYVAFSRDNTVAVIDAVARKVTTTVPVGVAPFSVAVAKKTGTIFVTNRGGRRPTAQATTAPSSGTDVLTDATTGAATSGTLSVVEPHKLTVREVAIGGGPSGIRFNPDESLLAVTNGHSDTVSLLNPATLARSDIKIPSWPEGTIGSQPTAAAFSNDGKTLYVGCGGSNAIVVLTGSGTRWTVKGALPTGWFPSALAVDNDDALRVVNIKGTGNTSNGKGLFNTRQWEGSLLRIPAPTEPQLHAGTREVRAANQPKFDPAGGVDRLSALGIKHVFFLIKENRTYDQVFGDVAKGNGDPKLAVYGRDVTPNHHKLAEEWVLLDNFYASGAISFEGHQWLMQAFVSDYVERALLSAPRGYAWNMSDALTVSPAGFFWQGAPRFLDVRLYGEFSMPLRWDTATRNAVDIDENDLPKWSENWRLYKEGKWQQAFGSRSGVPALARITHTSYPPSAVKVPDQIRAEAFLQDLAERENSGKMPNLLLFTMTSDHTQGTSPDAPTPRAMVADNDLALGRIVEGISKSRFWPDSLILVVEDDAQDGFDHVDGHRTVAMAIGPMIRRHALDSNHYNQISMVRTIQEIFRVPPRTRYLQAARAMTSIFTTTRDLTPYRHETPDIRLDTMNPPLKALAGRQLWAAQESARMNWNDLDDVPSDLLNRILWWDAKGYDTPYPGSPKKATRPTD
jgi:YVTN family beta-propeller protein